MSGIVAGDGAKCTVSSGETPRWLPLLDPPSESCDTLLSGLDVILDWQLSLSVYKSALACYPSYYL